MAILGILLIFVLGGIVLLVAFAVFFSVRLQFVPWFAQAACDVTGCGHLVMATAGWVAWALTVALVAILVIVYRQAPRWLFFTLLPPGVVLIFFGLMFGNYDHRGPSTEPTVHELIATLPGGSALDIGLMSGRWAAMLLIPIQLVLFGVAKSSSPPHKWAWQLAQLATPAVVLLTALGIALLAV